MAYLHPHRDYTRNYHLYDKHMHIKHQSFLQNIGQKVQTVGEVLGTAKGLYEVGKAVNTAGRALAPLLPLAAAA